MEEERFPEGFVEALVLLCDSYDAEYGEYPEHRYEGKAIRKYYYEILKRQT
jgi:hypothetical protein